MEPMPMALFTALFALFSVLEATADLFYFNVLTRHCDVT